MIIFIRNIPAHTRPSELRDFTQPALKKWLFFSYGKIVKVEVLSIKDKVSKITEFHGLIHVDSDMAGHIVIRRLKDKLFLGKPVVVREYFFRSWHNDHRLTHKAVTLELSELRKRDRRRGANIEMVTNLSAVNAASDLAQGQESSKYNSLLD